MRYRYTQDLFSGLWLVMIEDVVIRHFETEEECEQWIKEQMKGREIE